MYARAGVCLLTVQSDIYLNSSKWFVYAKGTCIFCAVGAEFGHQHRRHLHGVDVLVLFIRSL
jgi:hypothetical protein